MSANAIALIKAIQEKRIKPADLDCHQKKVIIVRMLEAGKYHQQEIADFLGLSKARIYQVSKDLDKYSTHLIDEVEIKKIASIHIKEAKRTMVELAKAGEWRARWEVQRGLIADLQSMGYITETPKKFEISLEDKVKSWDMMFGVTQQTPILVNAN